MSDRRAEAFAVLDKALDTHPDDEPWVALCEATIRWTMATLRMQEAIKRYAASREELP